jgi:hypothetical protein
MQGRNHMGRKAAAIVASVVAVLAVSVPGIAVAATAHHATALQVRITWRHGHATEIVTVVKDPGHVRVQAMGNCAYTGIANDGGAVVSAAGAVTRTRCAHGWWFSVGYQTSRHGRYWHYHAVMGTANLFG